MQLRDFAEQDPAHVAHDIGPEPHQHALCHIFEEIAQERGYDDGHRNDEQRPEHAVGVIQPADMEVVERFKVSVQVPYVESRQLRYAGHRIGLEDKIEKRCDKRDVRKAENDTEENEKQILRPIAAERSRKLQYL